MCSWLGQGVQPLNPISLLQGFHCILKALFHIPVAIANWYWEDRNNRLKEIYSSLESQEYNNFFSVYFILYLNHFSTGIDEALAQYVKIVPGLYLAEPKSFAPIINMAISTVNQNQGKQHVLVIISNGPVHRGRYTDLGQLSFQEQKTINAIENASRR